MRVLAAAVTAVVAATVAWSSAGAVDVQIAGYPFGCKTSDGEVRKPKFGDVDGIFFTNLPAERKACLETIDRMIYSCGINTTFISHDLNNRYRECLAIFERQAERCARHFELQRRKCHAGDSSKPAATTAEPAEPDEPEVEPADLTMWAAKRSNIRSGPGTDHAKVGLLEIGDEVQVTGEFGDWLRIEAPGGGDAFVWAPLLTEEVPVQVTTAAEKQSKKPSGTPSSTKTVRVPNIPDKAKRERVTGWMSECRDLWGELVPLGVTSEVLSSDQKLREFLALFDERSPESATRLRQYLRTCKSVGETVRESGRPCRELAREVNMNVDFTARVTDPDSYFNKYRYGQLDDSLKRTVDEYLQTCVTAYATVLDGRQLKPYRADDELATAAPAAGKGPLHGSISFSQESDGGYAWGIAWSFNSRADALAEAGDQCREYGGSYCTEVGWFQEACGALAIGDDNGYGAGWGDTTVEAERDALSQCRAANDNCRVEVARCSKSQEAGGKGRQPKEDRVAESPPKHVGPCRVFYRGITEEQFEFMFLAPLTEEYMQFSHALDYPRRADWTGPCADGLATGEGEATFQYLWHIPPDTRKSIYHGHARNGRFHGPGRLKTWKHYGTSYVYVMFISEGEWREGGLYEGTIISPEYCDTSTYKQGKYVGTEAGKC